MAAGGPDIGALLAGLGGGGGPVPGGPGPGGPDIGALLGGLGGGPPQGPGGGPSEPPQGGSDPVAILTGILDQCNQYLQVEPDEEDKLTMQKITTLIQQLKAKDQQDQDAAMGGSNARILRKAA